VVTLQDRTHPTAGCLKKLKLDETSSLSTLLVSGRSYVSGGALAVYESSVAATMCPTAARRLTITFSAATVPATVTHTAGSHA